MTNRTNSTEQDMFEDDGDISTFEWIWDGCHIGVSNGWHRFTSVFTGGINYVDDKVHKSAGRRVSSDDVLAVILLITGIVEATLSSKVWVSPRVKLGVSSFISAITLMNDRKNFNDKFNALAELQLNFIRAIQRVPSFVDHVSIKRRPNGKSRILKRLRTGAELDLKDLESYWHLCSEMEIVINDKDKTSITLHNLSCMHDKYTHLNNTAIAFSWIFAIINIGFDVIDALLPQPQVAAANITGDQFRADIDLDITELSPIPMSGNYTFDSTNVQAVNGTYTGTFSGTALQIDSFHTNPYYSDAGRAATVIGGVPFRSIANWITTYMLHQQCSMKKVSGKLADYLRVEFRNSYQNKRDALLVPRPLLLVLDTTEQTNKLINASQIKYRANELNKLLLIERERAQGKEEGRFKLNLVVQRLQREKQERNTDHKKQLESSIAAISKAKNKLERNTNKSEWELLEEQRDLLLAEAKLHDSRLKGDDSLEKDDELMLSTPGYLAEGASALYGDIQSTPFSQSSTLLFTQLDRSDEYEQFCRDCERFCTTPTPDI